MFIRMLRVEPSLLGCLLTPDELFYWKRKKIKLTNNQQFRTPTYIFGTLFKGDLVAKKRGFS